MKYLKALKQLRLVANTQNHVYLCTEMADIILFDIDPKWEKNKKLALMEYDEKMKLVTKTFPEFMEWINNIGIKYNKCYKPGDAWCNKIIHDETATSFAKAKRILEHPESNLSLEDFFETIHSNDKYAQLNKYISEIESNIK